MVGPFRGGRTVSVAGIPGQPNIYYFGAVGGGVWKTTNGGVTWKPIFDAQPVASIGAVAIAPSDSNTIYVGTGEPDLRSDLSTGNGMYKSTDAGSTWQHIGLEDTRQIARIFVDPKDVNVVVVAAVGHAYGPNPERGIFKSIDGGKNWKKVFYKDENTGAIDLAADPDNPRTLCAALWHVQRPPWGRYPPDHGAGAIYRSTDEGDTWTPLKAAGLPQTDWGRVGIGVARGTGGKRVYALIDTPKDPKQAGLSVPTMAARAGPELGRTRASSAGYGISARSISIPRIPMSFTCQMSRSIAAKTPARTGRRSRARPAATIITRYGSIRLTRRA
jgi:BNR/Asp-box repeat.